MELRTIMKYKNLLLYNKKYKTTGLKERQSNPVTLKFTQFPSFQKQFALN